MASQGDVIKVIFGPEPSPKTRFTTFTPSPGEVSPKIRVVGAITFHDASANADKKVTAPPKREICKIQFFGVKEHVLKKLVVSKNETWGIV